MSRIRPCRAFPKPKARNGGLCPTPGCTLPFRHSEPCALGRAKRKRLEQPDYVDHDEWHLARCYNTR